MITFPILVGFLLYIIALNIILSTKEEFISKFVSVLAMIGLCVSLFVLPEVTHRPATFLEIFMVGVVALFPLARSWRAMKHFSEY